MQEFNGSYLGTWYSWWRGYDGEFHRYFENSLGGLTQRELYRMNMAKKVCEDWASLIFNDKCSVSIDDEVGEKFVGRILGDADFMGEANRFTEKVFALGTGAAIIRLRNFTIGKNGELSADSGSSIGFEFVDARHIRPITVLNGKITEAAFVSESVKRGARCRYIESHVIEGGEYVIRNEFFVLRDGEWEKDGSGELPEVIKTGSAIPLFAILTPNIQNNYDEESGMGVSVFADAIDCLKGVDLAFNNFCRDIKLGGKKVFMSASLIRRDEYGNTITPDDVAQQLFVTLGDGDFSDNPMITEHNPELRASENALAVQAQLNYLAFRCGLGTHHYSFDGLGAGRAKLTATQYMGERQDMIRNLVKHQRNARTFVEELIRAVLWCGRVYFGLQIDERAKIDINFDDSYLPDSSSERERDLSEVEAGVMDVEEFKKKWSGGI